LEEKVKRTVAESVVRGRVELRIHVKDLSEAEIRYDVDMVKAKAYLEAIKALKHGLNLKTPISLDQFIGIPGVIQPTENGLSVDHHWPLMESCLKQALDDLDNMRLQEGEFLKKDFKQRLDFIGQSLEKISQGAQNIPALHRERLLSRIEALTKGLVELDQARIAQEAAILADRSDISEEIVRTRSHIDQFNAIIDGDEPAGRKLNFLLQELNREFNTMGAKAGQADIAHLIVDAKAEFEKLREQVQNIE
jgi:uncharacterized protein (TIGR00255 family)